MKFSEEEIAVALRLRDGGLKWIPKIGHYVFDEMGFCKQRSPFQDDVYFLLDYDCFMRTVGGLDRFQEIMTWLPTWFECREILAGLNISPSEITQGLKDSLAIVDGKERLYLYQMIESAIA